MADKRTGEKSVKMVANGNPQVQKQIKAAVALSQEILEEALSLFPDALKPRMKNSVERRFVQQIQLSAESFDVTFQSCDTKTVDRTVSMLSGPFFTSKKFPVPTAKREMLFPIVQVDLRTASSLINEALGDGLLQLWYDINAAKGIVRVIPRAELNNEGATEFRFVPAKTFEGWPLPTDWGSDPTSDEVRVMTEFKSMGFATQREYPDTYLNELNEEYVVPDELFSLVTKFCEAAEDKSSSMVHLFGTFTPIEYSAADVGRRCFLNINDWGSSGNAQVFYAIGKNGEVSFSFQDSLR